MRATTATNAPMEIRPIPLDAVRALCEQHHGYASAGGVSVYAWGAVENGRLVAAWAWQPPPPGAASSVCPEAPAGVLALSRMVAVPKSERELRHISKPLKYQMRRLIDRGRWPVLVTYSDEGQGHTGHVYKCSGWEKTQRAERNFFTVDGKRTSAYSNGSMRELDRGGLTTIQRWEHWVCKRGMAAVWMEAWGWRRVAVPGKKWRSGNQAYRWEQTARQAPWEHREAP